MTTYCENPVKLVALLPEERCLALIWHTRQLVTCPIQALKNDDPAELAATLETLKVEREIFRVWFRENQ